MQDTGSVITHGYLAMICLASARFSSLSLKGICEVEPIGRGADVSQAPGRALRLSKRTFGLLYEVSRCCTGNAQTAHVQPKGLQQLARCVRTLKMASDLAGAAAAKARAGT